MDMRVELRHIFPSLLSSIIRIQSPFLIISGLVGYLSFHYGVTHIIKSKNLSCYPLYQIPLGEFFNDNPHDNFYLYGENRIINNWLVVWNIFYFSIYWE